jgi:Lrp/AsnC family leucine-responsive transcriptional regulator
MEPRLDEKDIAILKLLQKDSKLTARKIAAMVGSPITTVFSKIKHMEELGLIDGYKAILDAKVLGCGTTAFIMASVSYRTKSARASVLSEIARLPQVQELQIITGDWDLLIKLKGKDVDTIRRIVTETLRLIKGIEKTLTCIVLETYKETTEIPIMRMEREGYR